MFLPFEAPASFSGEFVNELDPSACKDALEFVFRGNQLLVRFESVDQSARFRPSEHQAIDQTASARLTKTDDLVDFGAGCRVIRKLFFGRLGGSPCYAIEVDSETAAPKGTSWSELRSLFSVLGNSHFSLAGRAIQLIDWDRNHQFCGRCGRRTEPSRKERSRVCTECRINFYPRLSPAVMALVRKGRELLLARNRNFKIPIYSALAGFVEPGETLEQALEREVAEEAGIKVRNIRYFASQPWPFPNSLMIAFNCEYASGEICLRDNELADAQWFDCSALPRLPEKISISRQLIDSAIGSITDSICKT